MSANYVPLCSGANENRLRFPSKLETAINSTKSAGICHKNRYFARLFLNHSDCSNLNKKLNFISPKITLHFGLTGSCYCLWCTVPLKCLVNVISAISLWRCEREDGLVDIVTPATNSILAMISPSN